MKRHSLIFLLLLTVTLAVFGQQTQAASTFGQVSARVLEKIAILARTPLIFGYIKPGTSAGTVTITPDNQRMVSGSVKLQPGVWERAFFLIRGTPNRSYSIHTPSSLAVKPFALGGPHRPSDTILQAHNFTTYSVNAKSTAATGKLDRVGLDRIYMGATLIVPANATPGLYATMVPLTVSY